MSNPNPTPRRLARVEDVGRRASAPRPEHPEPGETSTWLARLPALARRMKIEATLGSSDQGAVLLVVERRTLRPMVLKVRALHGSSSFDEWDRFEHEAKVLRSLSHPGVPRPIDHGHDGPVAYLLMTRAPGRSLQQRLDDGQRWSDVKLHHILTRLLEVLAYLHDLNPPVFHCDVHPEHVVVSNSGGVQLISFGHARSLLPDDRAPAFGRRGYIPSAQLGAPASARHDLYALGATIAAIASGADAATLPRRSDGLALEQCMKPSPVRDAVRMLMDTTSEGAPSRSLVVDVRRWLTRAKR